MPSYLSPGVYVEEIPSGSKPIEGVSTSVAAFVGRATRGPVGEAVLIQNFDDYASKFGDVASEDDHMGLAVGAFYMNGGRAAYICRLAKLSDSQAASSTFVAQAAISVHPEAPVPVLKIEATSVGKWGNAVYVKIVKPDPQALTFDLEVGHHKKHKFVRDELYTGLSMDSQDDNYAVTLVNDNSPYVKLAFDPAAADKLEAAVLTSGAIDNANTTFQNAISGTMTLTLNIDDGGAEQISINLDGEINGGAIAKAIQGAVYDLSTDEAHKGFACDFVGSRFTLTSQKNGSSASVTVYDGDDGALVKILRLDSESRATLVGATLVGETLNNEESAKLFKKLFAEFTWPLDFSIELDGYEKATISIAAVSFGGKDHKEDGTAVANAIRDAVQAVNPDAPSFHKFDCSYANGAFTLRSGSASAQISNILISEETADGLSLLGLLGVEATPGRAYTDSTAKVIPAKSLGALEQGFPLTGGSEVAPSLSDYKKFFNTVLRKVPDASVIILPGEQWAKDGSNPKIEAAVAHCDETKTRMVIVDPPELTELEQAAHVTEMQLPTSTYTALYYPWIRVPNPLYNAETNKNAKVTLAIPPSAAVAGIWSKTDGTRGVWKAPAGVETQLLGIAGPQYKVEAGEQDQLNPLGVNCIRTLPNFGTVVWGARTLATKAKPEWRYVSVRRTAIFIEKSIYEGIQWAVFEPNDNPLWSSLRVNIESFMNGMFRSGAFQGAKASDAYFVRCGLGDTMTQGDIDRGQVIVIVGFAPLKPAEFVIVRIQQKIGQQ